MCSIIVWWRRTIEHEKAYQAQDAIFVARKRNVAAKKVKPMRWVKNVDGVSFEVRRGETLPVEGVDRHLASLIRRLKTIAPAERLTAVEAAHRLRRIREAPRRMVRRAVVAAMVAVVLLAGVEADLQYPGAKTKYGSRDRFFIEKLTSASED